MDVSWNSEKHPHHRQQFDPYIHPYSFCGWQLHVYIVQDFILLSPIAYEGEGRDGYRDQIVACDVGVSEFQDTSTVHEVQQWHKHTCSVMHITIRACFLCFFYNPYMSLFNSKNFSFTC